MNMDHFFDVYVSKERLSASLSLKNEVELDGEALTPQILNEWLLTKKIVFGVDQKVVQAICNNPKKCHVPNRSCKRKEA